jgi:hypothetical protein
MVTTRPTRANLQAELARLRAEIAQAESDLRITRYQRDIARQDADVYFANSNSWRGTAAIWQGMTKAAKARALPDLADMGDLRVTSFDTSPIFDSIPGAIEVELMLAGAAA